MSAGLPAGFQSRGFLLTWVGLPLLAFVLAQFFWKVPNSFLAMHFTALFLALFFFCFELRRAEKVSKLDVLYPLLYLAPLYLAAGRLHGLGWKGGAAFVFLGSWLCLGVSLRWLELRRAWNSWSTYLLLAFLLSFATPLVVYLGHDFGGKDWSELATVSPFVFSQRLIAGHGYQSGLIFFLCVAVLLMLISRRFQQKEVRV